MYGTVDYISTTGRIPILPRTPFLFNDDVVLYTEDELQKMDLSSLILYTSSLSTSITGQLSTLNQNTGIFALYTYLKKQSQGVVDTLKAEIQGNTAKIALYESQQGALDTSDVWEYDGLTWIEDVAVQQGGGRGTTKLYISTLSQFDSTIKNQLDGIAALDSKLVVYKEQYMSSMSSFSYDISTFNSTAKGYSTSVWLYTGYKDLYDEKQQQLAKIMVDLSNARMAELQSGAVLAQKRSTWKTRSNELSTLYDDRTRIGQDIVQRRINERTAYINYKSSMDALSTTSSMYNAALLNEQYAIALSELTGMITESSYAQSQFDAAQLAWEGSWGGGGTRTFSGTPTGNSVLKAARDMAMLQLEQKQAAQASKEASSSNLLTLATLANTTAYQTLLAGYDSRIDTYKRTQIAYRGYKVSSLQQVALFSSIYDQAVLDISQYTWDIKHYSTLYESSINGASTLLGLSDIDRERIESKERAYTVLSNTIRGLNREYDRLSGLYSMHMSNSSLYASQYYSSLSNVRHYQSMYDSANGVVTDLQASLYGPGGLMARYYATVFTNSTLLNNDIISQKTYDAEVMDLINQRDTAMQEYRETFCRYRRTAYQDSYEDYIYRAVEDAQANMQPIANLETPEIQGSRRSLSNINAFLGSFSNIYTLFKTQASNVTQISTSVGYESNAWSTLNTHTWNQYFNLAPVEQSAINSSFGYLTLQQQNTASLLQTFAAQQLTIDSKKRDILTGLEAFFTPSDILAQNDVISSFILGGASALLTTLQQTGSSELTWDDSQVPN
jgi:hypothetical protein